MTKIRSPRIEWISSVNGKFEDPTFLVDGIDTGITQWLKNVHTANVMRMRGTSLMDTINHESFYESILAKLPEGKTVPIDVPIAITQTVRYREHEERIVTVFGLVGYGKHAKRVRGRFKTVVGMEEQLTDILWSVWKRLDCEKVEGDVNTTSDSV